MRTSHRTRLRFLFAATVGLALTALLGGLGGCGAGAGAPTPTPTRTPMGIPTLPPTATPTPAPTPTPTLSPYVNPLTGEQVDDVALLDRVPVAIKISNWPPQYVRPQAGINDADLIFEHYNEGWFSTRWTAIYLDTDPEQVGPVRSGRLIDLEIPAIFKAVLACWGFSDGLKAIFQESDLYPDRVVSYSLPDTVSPDPFYRDTSRDVPLEHTGYTDPARVRVWAEAHGLSGRQDLRGMLFSAQPPVGGEPATYVRIPWRDLDTEWRYDDASGRYLRWSDGAPHVDALTGEQLGVANVVVLYVAQWDSDIIEEPHSGALSIRWALWNQDNPYRRALVFRDGVCLVGVWSRQERWEMLTLTDEGGNPIPLKVGSTFFEVIPTEGVEVFVEP
jgi:hypothetical protein